MLQFFYLRKLKLHLAEKFPQRADVSLLYLSHFFKSRKLMCKCTCACAHVCALLFQLGRD